MTREQELLSRLQAWGDHMGGFEANVWDDLATYMNETRQAPSSEMHRYLCVVELDVCAADDVTAARLARQDLSKLEAPFIHLCRIDDALPWMGADFIEGNDQPYISEVKPLCFDFI